MFTTRFTTLTAVLGILSLAFAGSAQAGGSGHSGGSSLSGGSFSKFVSGGSNSASSTGNSNSQATTSKLGSLKANGQSDRTTTPTSSNSSNSSSNSNPTKIAKPIDLGKLNQGKASLDPKLLQNTKLDKNTNLGLANNKNLGKLLDNKTADTNKMKFDNKFIKEHLKDYSKDKCFHDCCHKCPWWYCWNYPTWCPLYCGYWYECPVVEIHEGIDLQLLGVRMIDSGDPEQNQGPAFRVWVRNNSHVTIAHPFNVLVLAARGQQATADLPQAGVRVSAIEAQQVLPVDIRLPAEANQPGLPMLHVLVDSHREIAEVFEDNNGAVLNRSDILPVEATGGAEPAATEVTAN